MPEENYLAHNYVQVDVFPVSGTKVLWRVKSDADASSIDDKQFLEKYSLVMRNSFFEDESRVSENKVTVVAERYGGKNIGANGGGARVVNVGDIQLKGIGANQLVGEGAPFTHSYGGLDAQGAIKEIIYSLLIDHISPVGAQKLYGLILLDRKSAHYNGGPAWSTILVREKCQRPAHYLRSPFFKPKKQYANELEKDELRVRKIYQQIEHEAGAAHLVHKLQDFLDRSADQLSFCRMARFAHSVLSESNMTMDGRLLDTSVCGFVNAGANFCQISDFFNEPAIPLNAGEEIIYMLNKYGYESIDFSHLQTYYLNKFHQYLNINAGFIFAIERSRSLQLTSSAAWTKVVQSLNVFILSGNGEKSYALPVVEARDMLNEILAVSLYSINQGSLELEGRASYLNNFIQSLSEVMGELYLIYQDEFSSRRTFQTSLIIQTLKRAFLSSFFYLTYISKLAEDTASAPMASNVKVVIAAVQSMIEWVYEDLGAEKTTVFKSSRCSVLYLQSTDSFEVFDSGELMFSSSDAGELLVYLKRSDLNFKVLHYNFKPFLLRLAAFFYGAPESTFKGVSDVCR